METSKVNIKASMGGYGGKVVTTGTYIGNYCNIKATTDSQVTAVGNIEDLTALDIVAGDNIPGEFTSVTVISGKVILYNNIDGG